MDWLSSSNGLFWIAGKPGSGKSTLIDYLVQDKRMVSKLRQYSPLDWVVLRFFFDFRGGKGVTNSFEGLLRSLLYQLINKMPQVDVLGLDKSENDPFSSWPEHRLRDALRKSLESAKHGVCILVDGLDEYEGNVLEVIKFLGSLATSNNSQEKSIKICVSSRPEPIPSQFLQHLPHLSMSDHNSSGIRSYCSLTLEGIEPEVCESQNISQLSDTIVERAEGVFLWARFALEELIQGYSSGETLDEILIRLESIPTSLEQIYDRMLGHMEPMAKKECMVMLQLVCFAKRELSWQEHHMATKIAMDKDAVFSEGICGDEDSANMPKFVNTFARRLRAKAVGLLELVKDPYREGTNDEVRLIHKSVSTYLDQKGWQFLAESETFVSARPESLYVEICTRYLDRLLRHLDLEQSTSQGVWKDWYGEKGLYDRLGVNKDQVRTSYPFLDYAARFIFKHARSLESHGVSSYPLLHNSLTEQFVSLHMFYVDIGSTHLLYTSCCLAPQDLVLEGFDPIYLAFSHGLVLYCKSDLAARVPAPSHVFWDRALRCAYYSAGVQDAQGARAIVSLALQNVTIVQQYHIEDAIKNPYRARDSLELVLQHESVKDLQLTDSEGQEVKLLWFIAQSIHRLEFGEGTVGGPFMKAAKRRGEDVRQSCGPEGNLLETYQSMRPYRQRRTKLWLLREYYESMSWPFECDFDEIERLRAVTPVKDSEALEDFESEDEGSHSEIVIRGGVGPSENQE